MAWYDDEIKRAHVGTFESFQHALSEAERAAQKGWIPQGAIMTHGHVNVWRTAAKVALVLPFVAGGPSRSSDVVTVNFIRTPQWCQHARDKRNLPATASVARG